MTLSLAPGLADARSTAILSALDAGAAAARAEIYATARPAAGAAPGGAPLAIWTLARPSGTVADGVLTLAWAAEAFPATASGTAVWGRLYGGDGAWVMDGDCGLAASAALFRLGTLDILAGGLLIPQASTIAG